MNALCSAKKALILFLFVFSFQNLIQAQFDFQKEIRERDLIIVLVDQKGNDEGLTKNISLEEYNTGVEAFNQQIEASFEKYWKHSKVAYMSSKEFLALPGELAYEKAICYSSKVIVKGREFLKFSMNFIAQEGGKNENHQKNFYLDIESGKVPSDADFLYFIRKIEVFFEYEFQFSRRGLDEFLANHTLLIDEKMTKPSLEKISEVYPHPVKMTDKEEINRIAEEKRAGFIYVRYGRWSHDRVSFMFVNCENGEVVARSVFQEKLTFSLNEQSNRNRTAESKRDAARMNEPFYWDYGNESIGREIKTLYMSPVKFQRINFEHMSSMLKQYSVYPNLIDF